MTGAPPLRVVTLPARSVRELREEAVTAREAGGQIAEIRIDRLSREERQQLRDLFPAPLPLLATYRSRKEGGEGEDAPEMRRVLYETVRSLPFSHVDLEIARDLHLLGLFSERDGGARPVLSAHLSAAEGTRASRALIDSAPLVSGWVKVVFPADFLALRDRVLPLLDPPPARAFCLHTLGPTGPVLRLAAARLGMAAVYCSLPAPAKQGAVAAAVEPSQVRVDQIARLHAGGNGEMFALLGHPVAHSLSPQLQNRWLAQEHRPAAYVALDVASVEEFDAAIDVLPALGFRGFNITHPWKERALAKAKTADAPARRSGVANTLTVREDGLAAANTDQGAVRRRLEELRAEGRWDAGTVTILGAGGAARAAAVAAHDLGGRPLFLARRERAASEAAERTGAGVLHAGGSPSSRLIVHATPAGRAGEDPLPPDWMRQVGEGVLVLDFVYRPEDRSLEEACRLRGATYEDGERLLEYQAALSHAIWFGEPPSTDATREGEDPCTA